jgi:hypothetical protein
MTMMSRSSIGNLLSFTACASLQNSLRVFTEGHEDGNPLVVVEGMAHPDGRAWRRGLSDTAV